MLKRSIAFLVVVAASLLVVVVPAAADFGFLPGSEGFAFNLSNVDGSTVTQAGSHPFLATASIGLNRAPNEKSVLVSDGDLRDVHVALAPGLVGDVNVIPRCTQSQFATTPNSEEYGVSGAGCPPDTQVGVASVRTLDGLSATGENRPTVPVYNMVPPAGVPARFGFNVLKASNFLTPSVRTGGDYGLTLDTENVPQIYSVVSVSVKMWGVPADPAHDGERGKCLIRNEIFLEGILCPSEIPPAALLTQATSCNGPQQTGISMDSWENPGIFVTDSTVSTDGSGRPAGLEGCNRLLFAPSITARPDTGQADTPAGLTVSVKMPVGGLVDPKGLGSADLRDASVSLPAGVAINPGRAGGLATCPVSQDAIGTEEAPSCPAGSRIGTAQITTPLLSEPIEGEVFVVQSNPPDLKLLVAGSRDGINVKVLGDARLDEATGRITTSFTDIPQFPVSEIKLTLDGGSHAPLLTPPSCGTFETNADFTRWSTPNETDVLTGDSFAVNSATGGGACASPLPFAPTLTAGSISDQAGGSTSFSVLV